MVSKHRMLGIACDNNAAIWYSDSGVKCITSSPLPRAYIYDARTNLVVAEYRDGEVLPPIKATV